MGVAPQLPVRHSICKVLKMMRAATPILSAALTFGFILTAGARAQDAQMPGTAGTLENDPACKVTVAELVEKTGATVDYGEQLIPMTGAVYLKPPMSGASARLSCYGSIYTPSFLSTWEGGQFPPRAWFSFVAQCGAVVTGLPSSTVLSEVKKCRHAAFSDKSGGGTILTPKIRVECDVGISTSVRIDTPVRAELEEGK
jgi:hypothetical protein